MMRFDFYVVDQFGHNRVKRAMRFYSSTHSAFNALPFQRIAYSTHCLFNALPLQGIAYSTHCVFNAFHLQRMESSTRCLFNLMSLQRIASSMHCHFEALPFASFFANEACFRSLKQFFSIPKDFPCSEFCIFMTSDDSSYTLAHLMF